MRCHVLSYLEEAARRYPDQIALADANNAMTYTDVWAKVSTMGSELSQRVGTIRTAVAVCLHHDIGDVLSFFIIAFSGNFYVPVDLALPSERVAHILTAAEPAAIIAREGDKLPADHPETAILTPDDLSASEGADCAPWREQKDTDPLYLIFTSGSTGVPKGVLISHRSVIDMVEGFSDVFAFPEKAVFGNQAPFDFDVSVKDIYLSLKVGGRLEILEKKLFSFPKLLIERMNERQIDTIIWAVPALKIMSELDAFSADRPRFLRDVFFSGEVMPQKTIAYWREKLPLARYVNLYGPTEITCNCTYHILCGREGEALPIGKAFPNCSVFLLNGDMPTADGEIGEICVAGSCLALGYYNEPNQTERAFVPNPLEKGYRETIYRTGDMGRMQNGLLYYMGRADTQIKHMGHRIELAEIELSANACPGVDAAACLYDSENTKICLFFKGSGEEKELFRHLRYYLPKYMLPAIIRSLPDFPRTRTGKIDRKALSAMLKEDPT